MYQVINVYMIGPGICGVIKMTDCVPTVNARDGKTKMKEKNRFFYEIQNTVFFGLSGVWTEAQNKESQN